MLSQRKPLLPPDTRDQLLVQNPAPGLGEACSRSLADLEGIPVLGVIAGESLHVVRFTPGTLGVFSRILQKSHKGSNPLSLEICPLDYLGEISPNSRL